MRSAVVRKRPPAHRILLSPSPREIIVRAHPFVAPSVLYSGTYHNVSRLCRRSSLRAVLICCEHNLHYGKYLRLSVERPSSIRPDESASALSSCPAGTTPPRVQETQDLAFAMSAPFKQYQQGDYYYSHQGKCYTSKLPPPTLRVGRSGRDSFLSLAAYTASLLRTDQDKKESSPTAPR